ncbi:hypothetical protein E0L36_11330 [Streptomyces sp. AJS327]|uniref:hypothetical protein n=1 Tax=Streptomyces sp. AJS327 TaxID=2545265 RepID=UPI0015DFF418|nr:hypothetical protein [Streptomyces sp. AJS327]MBA0051462.1 hypothetical protein [Streptomyces sp. AJS327]
MFEIPQGFNLPSDAQKVLKRRDDLVRQLAQFKAENADYEPRKRNHYNHANPGWFTPALEYAEAQWAREMKEALKAGKDFKSLDEYLIPFQEKAAEYHPRIKALEELIAEADKELIATMRPMLGELVDQAFTQASKAETEYAEAMRKAQSARAEMGSAVNRFCWAVTGGRKSSVSGIGFGSGTRDGLGGWQATGDGRITVESMRALGLYNQWEGALMLPEFEHMVYNPENPLAEEVGLEVTRNAGTHECPACGLRVNTGGRRVSCVGTEGARHTRTTFVLKDDLEGERHPNFPKNRGKTF